MRGSSIKGTVTDVSKNNWKSYWLVSVDGQTYSLRDCNYKDRNDLKEGHLITLFFPNKERYYSDKIINHTLLGDGNDVRGGDMKEELEKILEDELLFGDVLPHMSQKEVADLRDAIKGQEEVAVRILSLHYLYDDCKKKPAEIAKDVITVAATLAITLDFQTNQTVKKAHEKAKPEAKA